MRRIKAAPLTAAAFAPYGDVIETASARKVLEINYGFTIRFDDLADLEVEEGGGKAIVSLFRSKPPSLPIQVKVMERHPLGSQAFIPLTLRPFLVVVSPPGPLDPSAITVFLASNGQGVNYRKGVWHHFSLALGVVSDFLVIDRAGPGDNLNEVSLSKADQVEIEL